ncbi:hypothetical protein TRIUR3_19067 [Triticum urartu]|uniref:Uncharacterized protein n=1 Tax=Triticum urartu TaxID=4572 RepID=M7YT24_TRIUA|nr:hypothetical protein TRIUR3_19067 [Triticum urartu]
MSGRAVWKVAGHHASIPSSSSSRAVGVHRAPPTPPIWPVPTPGAPADRGEEDTEKKGRELDMDMHYEATRRCVRPASSDLFSIRVVFGFPLD